MRFDHYFITFGVFTGAALPLVAGQIPGMKAVPALIWLLGAILVFDVVAAYVRGVPVAGSVSTPTRAAAFIGGGAMLLISGGIWG